MEISFSELKKEFEKIAKNHKMPPFSKLNEDFEIGKIENDSGTLIRAVRKTMMEKIVNSLGFLEMLLNPMNVPRMYVAYVSTMSADDKKRIEEIYGKLSFLSTLSLEREIEYDEKKEAELIDKIFSAWGEVKEDFLKILQNMKNPKLTSARKERSYFG